MRNLTIITAEIMPGKYDPMAEAYFFNTDRAFLYGQILADSGDYHSVELTDTNGNTWEIPANTKED